MTYDNQTTTLTQPQAYISTLRSANGYVFNVRHESAEDLRDFLKTAAGGLLPGETLSYVVLH